MQHASTFAASVFASILLVACGGGGRSPGAAAAGGDFVVLRTTPTTDGVIHLNDPIDIDFSLPIDLDSASLQTIRFDVFDQVGAPVAEVVSGTFELARQPEDAVVGRRLRFVPHHPDDDAFTNGGFRAGRTYVLSLVGGDVHNGSVLRAQNGRGLERPATLRFRTKDGTQPEELFRNPRPGGPHRVGLSASTVDADGRVPLNRFGAPPLELRLAFDQALNPASTNVPVAFDPNPLRRRESDRGRIWLEYAENAGAGPFVWIPADLELERNDLSGATVVLRPVGVLPNNATLRVIVQSTLEDISGESNVTAPDHDEVFGELLTNASYAPQWNGIAEDFLDHRHVDFAAAFAESQAEVGQGFVRAGFAFEGNGTTLEYEPTSADVVLNTAFTQITPKSGLPFTVSGGVFQFARVRIPSGVHVQGQGPNPMVWLCSGDFVVEGTLSVRGGNGARVDTLTSANFAKAGGVGVCGGGNGGDGTPLALLRDLTGGIGRGGLQVPGKGGRGGRHSCNAGAACLGAGGGGGSGGGGGALATQGDPFYRGAVPASIVPNQPPTTNTRFQQVRGYGGSGCGGTSGDRSAFLAGGEPGDLVFVDGRADNDFWGSAVRLGTNGSLRITGELSVPMGGGGGGGGGDRTSPAIACSQTAGTPASDNSGGGGGGGGGVLIVKALGDIVIGATGRIVADGGNGGGGEQAGTCNQGGGGGGGAGGMVVLMTARRIVLHAHGSAAQNRYTYGPTELGQNDYSFAISADGGVTTTGTFGTPLVTGKYPANGSTMLAGTSYDEDPLGGLGGMGLIQLMAPIGDNADGTNTRLDDHIVLRRTDANGTTIELAGSAKQALLGWRGFPGTDGIGVDDFGGSTGYDFADPAQSVGYAEGDLRPAPVLLPSPFQARSRLRSRWIDTGLSQRRELAAPDGLPLGVVGAAAGPAFEFAGIETDGPLAGYALYTAAAGGATPTYGPVVVEPAAVTSIAAGEHLGAVVFRLRAAGTPFGERDRYAAYEAELLDAADNVVGSHRIVAHDAGELVLDPNGGGLVGGVARVRVRAKFFRIDERGSEGLGKTYAQIVVGDLEPRWVPRANVRIGFAFHQDPQSDAPDDRFPADAQQFVHDLQDPALLDWIAAKGAPRFVAYDVLFDLAFADEGTSPGVGADSPRPELRSLRLPFRF